VCIARSLHGLGVLGIEFGRAFKIQANDFRQFDELNAGITFVAKPCHSGLLANRVTRVGRCNSVIGATDGKALRSDRGNPIDRYLSKMCGFRMTGRVIFNKEPLVRLCVVSVG